MSSCRICEKPITTNPAAKCGTGDCECMDKGSTPCVCSQTCEDALFTHRGLSVKQIRLVAGIKKWKPPVRIQLSRKKGWRMPSNTVKCDRSTEWGNPFRIGMAIHKGLVKRWGWKFKNPEFECRDAAEVVKFFAGSLAFDGPSIYVIKKELQGKNLACWCRLCETHKEGRPVGVDCDQCAPCHVDIILKAANQ